MQCGLILVWRCEIFARDFRNVQALCESALSGDLGLGNHEKKSIDAVENWIREKNPYRAIAITHPPRSSW